MEALPKQQLLRATEQVVSATTHFTFMINACWCCHHRTCPSTHVLKDLKAANPTDGIDLISVPEPQTPVTRGSRCRFDCRRQRAIPAAVEPRLRLDGVRLRGLVGASTARSSPSTRASESQVRRSERYLLTASIGAVAPRGRPPRIWVRALYAAGRARLSAFCGAGSTSSHNQTARCSYYGPRWTGPRGR